MTKCNKVFAFIQTFVYEKNIMWPNKNKNIARLKDDTDWEIEFYDININYETF